MKSILSSFKKATRGRIRSVDRFRHFRNWQATKHPTFLLVHDPCILGWRLPGSLGQWCTLNSLLSVQVRDTRHLIFYTLKSVSEAHDEQPHLTGGSRTKPGGKTGSSYQPGNDRRRGSGLPDRSSGLQHSSSGERPKLQVTPDCNQ